MTKTYAITTATATRYVDASSRQAAVIKMTGMRESAALAAGQILAVKLCRQA